VLEVITDVELQRDCGVQDAADRAALFDVRAVCVREITSVRVFACVFCVCVCTCTCVFVCACVCVCLCG